MKIFKILLLKINKNYLNIRLNKLARIKIKNSIIFLNLVIF